MIKIITEKVDMPGIYDRRYIKECKNGNINGVWTVIDRQLNKVVYKGKFDNVCLACHNLNKKHYMGQVH